MTDTKTPRFRPAPSVASLQVLPERPLPTHLQHDWEAMEKLVKAADRQKLDALCELLDIVDWATYEVAVNQIETTMAEPYANHTHIEDVRLFIADEFQHIVRGGQAQGWHGQLPAQARPYFGHARYVVGLPRGH